MATDSAPMLLPKISSSSADEALSTKPAVVPAKVKIAETIRVESDRLDHLMNLAGELVITKARFVAIGAIWVSYFRDQMPVHLPLTHGSDLRVSLVDLRD